MDLEPLVFDLGSGTCYAGFAGDDSPKSIISSIVGRPLLTSHVLEKTEYIGKEVQEHRELLSLSSPFSRSIITNWDDLEKIFNYFYKDLYATPSNQAVMITETPFNPKANKEKLAQMMFETFEVPGMGSALKALMSIFASGYLFGTIVESGESVTHILPVDEGVAFTQAMMRVDLAGRDVSGYLGKMIEAERGHSLDPFTVQSIKEQFGYVARNFDSEVQNSPIDADLEKNYKLPDGKYVTVGSERFRCAEVMFHPEILGRENYGIHEITYNSIMKCSIDVRRDLFTRIILSGGNTLLPGFADRLQEELTFLFPKITRFKAKVLSMPERKYSAWIGGSIYSSLSSFSYKQISKQDYAEYGPSIVHFM